MSKHTEGPLHVGGDGTIIYDPAGWAVANATVFHGRHEPGTAQANARRIVACVNACEGLPTDQLEQKVGIVASSIDMVVGLAEAGGEALTAQRNQLISECETWEARACKEATRAVELEQQRDIAEARIDWIEKVNTLHRQVELLYVVDGYTATLTWDGHPISEDFHGETIEQAIDKAMACFDLDSTPKLVNDDRSVQDPVDRQLAAVEKQRDQLLAALEAMANCYQNTLTTAAAEDRKNQRRVMAQAQATIAKARGQS